MPENFISQLGDRSEKLKNESEFFTIEVRDKGLIIKLKPEKQLSRQLDRLSASDFRQQLTYQIKSRQPCQITIDLAGKDIGKEIISAIFFISQQVSISKENFILCRVSKNTKHKLQELGFLEKIFTIKKSLDNLN